ncbi:hypothetical protein V499_07477 [Pseudogymnoascus sp. VKM F-103]|nr:hypothetical protein V499_07477 [Pseudogymnoascus sp. VKM F-103]
MTLLIITLLIANLFGVALGQGPLTQTIELPIDHFNTSDTRTFLNRFWINDTFYEPGGPVFFFDQGEAGVGDTQPETYLGPQGELIQFAPLLLAEKYNGIAIIWEHRFYGSSLPFEVDNETGLALEGYGAYKYLTNEQALEDAVYFARHFSPAGYDEKAAKSLRADKTPWIWLGGSYPGIRAAMIRQRNPETFFASWSSSAPVQAVVDGNAYYNTIQQTMSPNCSADMHAAVTYADQILKSGTADEIALFKRAIFLTYTANPGKNNTFNTFPVPESPEDLTEWAIASIITHTLQGSLVAFQTFGYARALQPFCNDFETWNPANFTGFTLSSPITSLTENSGGGIPTPDGIAASSSPELAFYAYLYATTRKMASDYIFLPNAYFSPSDRMAWTWQLCSEFGEFQTTQAHSSPATNIVTEHYDVDGTIASFCHGPFPYAPAYPNVSAAVGKYGSWGMRPSNVMFTNGELDPLRSIGVQADKGINPEALDRKSTETVPPCGVPPPGNDVFGVVYEGAVHVSDLAFAASGPAPVEKGRALFESALDVWLDCFGKEKDECHKHLVFNFASLVSIVIPKAA